MKRVLVVDDDNDLRELMRALLSERYDVALACDGAEGVELARRLRPDLVVMDLLMPKMHGFEACRVIRGDAELKDAKILIVSSKSYRTDMRTAVEEAGADGYILKPFAVAEFKSRVAELLGEG